MCAAEWTHMYEKTLKAAHHAFVLSRAGQSAPFSVEVSGREKKKRLQDFHKAPASHLYDREVPCTCRCNR